MQLRSYILFLVFSLITSFACAQDAVFKGKVTNSKGEYIPNVNILLDKNGLPNALSDSNGNYNLKLPTEKILEITFKHTGFTPYTIQVTLKPNEIRTQSIVLKDSIRMLKEVDITSDKLPENREEAGTIAVSAESLKEVTTAFGDFNNTLASASPSIVSRSELSSSYSVRGGSFDENLVYVNNIQVYRPFLTRSGQQEGLSFVNSSMVESVEFSAGGWQAKYGDKLSSVLNIKYKTPKKFGASLGISLLGGSAHIEGASKNKRISYVAGFRHKSAEYLLNTMETSGEYLPRFTDFQSYLEFDLSRGEQRKKTTLGVLTSIARNRYKVEPQTRETEFGIFNDIRRLLVGFDGRENMNYDTFQGGLKLSHKFTDNFQTNLIASGMKTAEREYIDLESGYRIADVAKEVTSDGINEEAIITGIGTEYLYARNALDAEIMSIESRNKWVLAEGKQSIEFGFRGDREVINDHLYEYSFMDSADYVIERSPLLKSNNTLDSYRLSGYLQTEIDISSRQKVTIGGRANYWSVNKQWLFSPRIQYSIHPEWEKDMVFSFSAGMYHQPPFYREMRDFEGNLNTNLKAQSSWHAIAGMDYNFEKWGRPFKLISEVYYKKLWNVVAYDIDDVRLRYYANNNTTAYVGGLDIRLSGEFIPNTESWVGMSIMSTEEDMEEDGREYIRRPTDQRVTFTMFFRDHIPNNPSLRVYLKLLYGSGLPYGPPNSIQNRASLSGNSDYKRVDIGFSKVIKFGEEKAGIINKMSIGLEVLNLIGSKNNISFTWVKDFNNINYAVPNSLSQRFFNLKLIVTH